MTGGEKAGGRLVRQSGLYALGNLAVKASGLVLAPFYLNTAYLSVADFGYFALLNVTAQLGIFVVGLGLATGMLRFMAGEHTDDPAALPFTALLGSVATGGVALALWWGCSAPLAGLLLDEAAGKVIIRLLGVYVFFKVVGSIPMTLMRVRERAGLYAVALAAEMVFLIGGVYYFLVRQGMGLAGVMWAYVWAAGVSTVILTTALLVREPRRFHIGALGPLVRFGTPLVLAGLAGWFLNAGDRYLLKWLADPVALARYEWSARLGGIVNLLVVQSFQLAFAVVGLKAIRAGTVQLHRQAFRHYTVWTGWVVLALSLLTFDLMSVLVGGFRVDPFYQDVQALVLPLALGFLAYGIYMIVNNVLYASGDTAAIGVNVLVAALFNAGMNVVVIPFLGAMGAALTTVAAYLLLALLTAHIAERKYPVGYPWGVFAGVVLLIVGLFLAGEQAQGLPVVGRLLVRFALLLAYFPLVLLTRLYTLADLKALLEHGGAWFRERRRL